MRLQSVLAKALKVVARSRMTLVNMLILEIQQNQFSKFSTSVDEIRA